MALVGGASVLVAALLSWMITWWASAYDRVQNVPYGVFDQRDLVPVGYALFAFALGVVVGAVLRRTLPAMAATLAGFVLVRYAVTQWVRPRLFTPVHQLTSFSSQFLTSVGGNPSPPGTGSINPADWFLSQETLTAAGQVIGQNGGIGPDGEINFVAGAHGATVLEGVGTCPNRFPSPTAPGAGGASGQKVAHATASANEAVARCLASFHLRTLATFQPESRYWPFQWVETAIFVALAVALLGGALWWVRRRLS